MAYCSKFTNKGLSYLANGKGCNKVVHLDLSGCEQVTWKAHAVFWICCHESQRVMSRYYKEMVMLFCVVSFDIRIELIASRITTRPLSRAIFFPFISMLVYWFIGKCSCLFFSPIVVLSSLNLTYRLGSLSYRARKRKMFFWWKTATTSIETGSIPTGHQLMCCHLTWDLSADQVMSLHHFSLFCCQITEEGYKFISMGCSCLSTVVLNDLPGLRDDCIQVRWSEWTLCKLFWSPPEIKSIGKTGNFMLKAVFIATATIAKKV